MRRHPMLSLRDELIFPLASTTLDKLQHHIQRPRRPGLLPHPNHPISIHKHHPSRGALSRSRLLHSNRLSCARSALLLPRGSICYAGTCPDAGCQMASVLRRGILMIVELIDKFDMMSLVGLCATPTPALSGSKRTDVQDSSDTNRQNCCMPALHHQTIPHQQTPIFPILVPFAHSTFLRPSIPRLSTPW